MQEVAETIAHRHEGGSESFVFGLSGRWGEGKTFFLTQLEAALQSKGYEVVHLNPWKYAADRVAFLRSFLVQLLEMESGEGLKASVARRWKVAWRLLWHSDPWWTRPSRAWAVLDLFKWAGTRRSLRVDESRQSISWVRLIGLSAFLYLAYAVLSVEMGSLHGAFRAVALVPVGFAIWLAQGLVGSHISTKAATALDEFDALCALALGVANPRDPESRAVRKIVVFVDDLDRVTAAVARGVLDNLRTFFDKPALSFVVTGDHEVLEVNLGAELAPSDASPEEQKELGRLFLKKIFNVYWRLPLPVPSEFENYVDRQMEDAKFDLERLIPAEEDQRRLRDWLLLYSGHNLRQVERVLDTVLFSLRLVDAQRKAATDPQQQRVLIQMCEEPMLLARVLFIQDKCSPFFEMLVDDAELLYQLDVEIHDARSAGGEQARGVVAEFLKRLEGATAPANQLKLTDPQREFLTKFAYEPPSFHDPSRGKRVAALAPWIHLACDAGLQDSAGPRPEDMIRVIENQNREALSSQLAACSETRAQETAPKLIAHLAGLSEADRRAEQLYLVLEELASASSEAPLVRGLTAAIHERLAEFLLGAADSQRTGALMRFASVLDAQGHKAIPDDLEQHFVSQGFGDLQRLERAQLGVLQSIVVIDWLGVAYDQNQADALPLIEELAPYLSLEGASETPMAELMARVREDLLTDESDARRSVRLQLLTGYAEGELPTLKAQVLESVRDESVWRWAAAEADGTCWALAELEAALLDAIVGGVMDSQVLVEGLAYSVGKLDDRAEELWTRIEQARDDHLLGLVEPLAARADLAPLALPGVVATRLYERLAHQVWETVQGDEGAAVHTARLLDIGVWLWSNVDKHSVWKALRPLADRRYRFTQLQNVVRPFRETCRP